MTPTSISILNVIIINFNNNLTGGSGGTNNATIGNGGVSIYISV